VASDGSQANADSIEPVITGGGRIVAFSSRAANLVPGDSNGTFDVFVHNRATERTERVSVASDGGQGNDHSNRPTVSGDGRVVAFESLADDLAAADGNSSGDAFVHNRATGRTELVSVARDGSQASGPSLGPEISRDGRVVTFQDTANDLVAGDSNGNYDVFVAKRTSPAGCTITGSGGDDVLIGTAGDDVLCGMGGHDRLIGRGGDDRLRGGLGPDRLRGGRGADRLRGERGPDRLYGGPGPDRLYGGPGDDRLRGGPGRDRLRGGPGDDRLRGRLG
jgi:Ca2+-binding RTX toxin-like protein